MRENPQDTAKARPRRPFEFLGGREEGGLSAEALRLVIAAVAFIVTLMLGTLYAWGVFAPTLEAYFGWSRAQAVLPFSVASVVFALAMVPAGRVQDKRGPGFVVALGGLLAGLGYVLSSRAGSLWQLALLFGLVGGVGIALGYSGAAIAGVRWFPDHKGTATGILVGGFGLGALAFGPVGHWLTAGLGWRNAFLILGLAFAVVILLLSRVVRSPLPDWKPKGWDPARARRAQAAENTGLDFSTGEAVRTVEFVGGWLQFLLGTSGGFAIITHIKAFAMDFGGHSPETAVGLVALFSLLNFCGRLVLGPLSDNIGRLNTFVLAGFLMTLAGAAPPLSLAIGLPELIYLAPVLGGAAFGGYLALSPAMTADIWGMKNLGTNYGAMFTAWGVGGLLGPFLAGKIYDLTGRYEPAFWLLAALSLVGSGVVQLVVKPALRARMQAQQQHSTRSS